MVDLHLRLLLGASLAITIIIGGLAVVAFTFSTPARNTGDQQDQKESFVPRPDSVPLAVGGDLEISVDEAREWAARSDFDFKLPSETHGLTLQSIVPLGIGPKASDNPELVIGEARARSPPLYHLNDC